MSLINVLIIAIQSHNLLAHTCSIIDLHKMLSSLNRPSALSVFSSACLSVITKGVYKNKKTNIIFIQIDINLEIYFIFWYKIPLMKYQSYQI